MCISSIKSCMFYIRDSFKSYVTVTYQNSTILKSLYRTVACCITEFMAVHCTVNKIICSIKLTHGTCLKERMSFIRSTDRFLFACDTDIGRSVQYGQHIRRIQFKAHRAMFGRLGAIQKNWVSCQCKTRVQIQSSIVIHKEAWVELERFVLLSNCDTITVFYVSVELIFSCRLIAYSYRDHLCTAHKIVQIKSSIRSLHHVRCCKTICQTDSRGCRILLSLINAAFITPVTKIIYRC